MSSQRDEENSTHQIYTALVASLALTSTKHLELLIQGSVRLLTRAQMDSPFGHILHTNAVPSDGEQQQIRDFLADPLQQLAELDQEIARLEQLLDVAYQKREALHSFTDAHLALLSPSRRLPDDIVRAIFLASLPPNRNPAISGKVPPLLLGQICSAWRSIALETPRLWASIHIVIPDEGKLDRLTHQVGAWLGRSGAVPLDISLRFSKTAFTDDTDSAYDISPISSLLIAECHRWGRINLILQDTPNYTPISALTPDAVPLLRSFSLEIQPRNPLIVLLGQQNAQQESMPSLPLLGANNLQSLTIPGLEVHLRAPIGWANLHHLSIMRFLRQGITYEIALGILSQCPLLKTCKLCIARANNSPSISFRQPEHISLPFLTELAVLNDRRSSLLFRPTQFFKDLTLPILRSFHCQGHIRPGQPLFPRPYLFPNELHTLECLRVELLAMPSDLLIEVLSETVSLRELHISYEPHTHDVPDPNLLTHLIPTATNPQPPCPQLEILTLTRFTTLSDATLLQLIQSRLNSPLSSVACRFQRAMQFDIMSVPGIQDAVAAGLKIDLKYHHPPAAYSALEGTPDYAADD